jgi:hypothetical protein
MKKIYYLITGLLLLVAGCKKLVEVDTPENQLTTDKVFADTTSAIAAMVNAYTLFDKTIDPVYNKYMGIYTDELNFASSNSATLEFKQSVVTPTNSMISNIWSTNYFSIYSCNQIIEQLQQAPKIPSAVANSLSAEAKFLRAYSNFYLVNTFGAIPLILTTNVDQTSRAARSDTAAVYAQIVKDLKDAQSILSENHAGNTKVRANKWAATALLARIYLYQQKWADAESQATAVINSGLYTPLNDPSALFLAGSNETILQFWTQNGAITDAASLITTSGVPTYPVSDNLLAAFEAGDQRKTNWLKSTTVTSGGTTSTYYYPYKYHNNTANSALPEYLSALRIGEQYLIRAEARAQQGNIPGAILDINVIRNRAGLANLAASMSQKACIDAVMQEWRIEFCFEWGHRFLELRRTGRLNTVMSAYKSTWLPRAVLLPLPQKELTYDASLIQNSGY